MSDQVSSQETQWSLADNLSLKKYPHKGLRWFK